MVVHAGDSGRAIGATLQKAGVVKTAKAFADAAAGEPPGRLHPARAPTR